VYFVRKTHRGPVLDTDAIRGSEVLFSGGIPMIQGEHHYSLAWTGHSDHEHSVTLFSSFNKLKTAIDMSNLFDSLGIYHTVPQNLVFAFDNGDIGYILAANYPNRKNKTPYSGCRVLDGTNSDNDWDGYLPAKSMPRVINPKKGYIVTANNRVVPENSELDIGATITSTVRAQRITELIQSGIDKG
jgi:penicillin amidase